MTILDHFKVAGPLGTYLASTCKHTLSTGEEATLVYIMPKHQLSFAADKRDDMMAMMNLALTTSRQDVEARVWVGLEGSRFSESCCDICKMLFQMRFCCGARRWPANTLRRRPMTCFGMSSCDNHMSLSS